MALLNPNTRTCPIFRTRADAELTKAIYRRVPVLVNEQTGNNPWGVSFLRMFDMANDSGLFRTRKQLESLGARLEGNVFRLGRDLFLPLYEAKMIWQFDHRFGSYEGVESRSNTHLPTPTPEEYADPGLLAQPWYWIKAQEIERRLERWEPAWLLGFRDVTNATNERTAIFSLLPRVGVGHKLPLVFVEAEGRLALCFVASVNSLVVDYAARQKVGGVSMSFYYVKQLPVLPPDAYTSADLDFIAPRVLELVYTAWDLKPFADHLWRDASEGLRAAILKQWQDNRQQTGGNGFDLPDWADVHPQITPADRGVLANRPRLPSDRLPLPPFRWSDQRRAWLCAQLDAYYARLYGLNRKQLRYILDPADLTAKELEDILDPHEEVSDPLDPAGYAARCQASDWPGETFRVLKEKELREYGEYRTRRLLLEAWNLLECGGLPPL